MRRPALRRNALTKAMSKRDYSQRRGRACSLITVDPRTWRYASYRPCDTEVRGLPRHLAGERCQFPYQGRHIFLECEGVILIHKKLFRLYRKEGLSVH